MYTAFHQVFPDVGVTETRTVTEIADGEQGDTLLFLEMYCDEVGCDCRRVFIEVDSVKALEAGRPALVATLVYGWEPAQFYRDWARHPLTAYELLDLKGPTFPMGSPQTARSDEMLAYFKDMLKDRQYVERLKRHYARFRAAVEVGAVPGTSSENRAQRRATKRRKR